jgi:hypothetical protein
MGYFIFRSQISFWWRFSGFSFSAFSNREQYQLSLHKHYAGISVLGLKHDWTFNNNIDSFLDIANILFCELGSWEFVMFKLRCVSLLSISIVCSAASILISLTDILDFFWFRPINLHYKSSLTMWINEVTMYIYLHYKSRIYLYPLK